MSEKSERLWRGFAVFAAFVYLVAMFAPWYSVCYKDKGWPSTLASTVTKACGGWGGVLGIASVALCYLILVFALLGPRRSALSLEPLRTALSLGLVALTVLEIYSRLGLPTGANDSELISRFSNSGRIGYGAWVALGSSLALLLAFSVLGAGGLGKLLNRLPAWARLDRLEEPEDAKKAKPDTSLAERSHRRWTGVLVLALTVYVLSLFANWWYSSPEGGETHIGDLNLFRGGMHFDGLEGIGEFCALAALATLFTAYLARQGKDKLLERLRNALLGFLIVLTLVNVPVVSRVAHDNFSISIARFRPDWGALAGLLSILLMLLATLVLNARGWAKLMDQVPSRARLGRLDEPPRQREETR
jgi:hypothetical protein